MLITLNNLSKSSKVLCPTRFDPRPRSPSSRRHRNDYLIVESVIRYDSNYVPTPLRLPPAIHSFSSLPLTLPVLSLPPTPTKVVNKRFILGNGLAVYTYS